MMHSLGKLGLATVLLLWSVGCAEQGSPNLLLVILDTTRADVLSPYGGRAQMPNLDRLAEAGVLFEDATSHNPFTLGSTATVFTSLQPDLHGIKGHSGFALAADATTLAEVMTDAGYETAAFVSAVPLRKDTGIGQGFATYDDDLSMPYAVYHPQYAPVSGSLIGAQRRGAETIRRAVDWLNGRNGNTPFFLTVHLFDPHEPYDPIPDYMENYPGDPYAAEVASTDAMIGELLSALTQAKRRENTVVCVVADHGESFEEHNEVGHGAFLYQTTQHVPWILSGPGIPACRVQGTAPLVDVAPTLLGACGQAAPASFQGRNLLEPVHSAVRGNTTDADAGGTASAQPRFVTLEDQPVYLETYYMRMAHRWSEVVGWREGNWKYLKSPRPELYDLRRDPAETQNRIESEAERATKMERSLQVYLQRDSFYRLDARTAAPNKETAEQLAALGYVGTAPTESAVLKPGWEMGLEDPKDAVIQWNQRQKSQAALRLAASQLEVQNFGEALKWAETSLELDPEKKGAQATRCHALAGMGQVASAIDCYQALLDETPDDAALWQSLGTILDQSGNPEAALDAYKKALEIDPKHGKANLFVGLQFVRKQQFDQALPHYQLAALADPKSVATLQELARVHIQLEQLPKARVVLEQALRTSDSDPTTLLMLGQICQKMGDDASTKAVLEAFIRFHPNRPESNRIRSILASLGAP